MRNREFSLTSEQKKNIEVFLHYFAEIEQSLKFRLGLRINDTTGVGTLIDRYEKKNPLWAEHASHLRKFAQIRNFLTHHRTTAGYPVIVAPSSVNEIREVSDQLRKPEPVGAKHRKPVSTVLPSHSLASVLTLAYQKGFSQFPVVDEEGFRGLVTENEIIRWLGRQVKSFSTAINLENATVRSVLKEKDPDLQGIAIFHFVKLDSPTNEVIGRFSAEPALEVILLSASGTKATRIEGIITQWDAARFQR